MDAIACNRCFKLARDGKIMVEAVMPLPPGAFAPLARDRSGPCCRDCAAADTVVAFSKGGLDFEMARVAVANDRQEQFRLPGIPMGLVQDGLVQPSEEGDFERHLAWLDRQNWFGLRDEES